MNELAEVRLLIDDLDIAAMPTKSEVAVYCGAGAAAKRDAVKALLSRLQSAEARVRELEGALTDAAAFIHELGIADLDEIAADGGVTVGMVFQQQARTVHGPRARETLRADGSASPDESGLGDSHG